MVLVQSDTRATVDRLEALLSTGRTPDAATVERMVELLSDHANLAALLGDHPATDQG